ncbi:MAG: Uracil-DNA glycosylase, family 4, partial [uncultured Blastococcus sp.]
GRPPTAPVRRRGLRGGPGRRRGPRLDHARAGEPPVRRVPGARCCASARRRRRRATRRAAPLRAGRRGARGDRGRDRPAVRGAVRRAAGPAARRGGPGPGRGRRPQHRQVPAARQPHPQGARGGALRRVAASPARPARPAGGRRARALGSQVVPRSAHGAGPGACPPARGRRPRRVGDLPSVGGDPLRPQRRAPRGAAGGPDRGRGDAGM